MEIDTWVSLAVLVGGLTSVYWAMRREFNTNLTVGLDSVRTEIQDLRVDLKADIADCRAETQALRTELKGDISELRTELKADIGELRTEVKADIDRLDDRIYALAIGLRPLVEQHQRPDVRAVETS